MRALEGWVDKITGVIGSVVLEPPDDDNARMPFVVSAAPPYVVDDDGALKRLPLGWGKGFTISGALLSAVGEAIERYAASLPDPDSITWNPAEDLDAPVLDPRELVFYSPEQYGSDGFPYSRFNPDVCHPWVKGTWLGRDTSVWVPAIFTYLSLSLRSEQLLCQGSSNGLAASFDAETAAVSAVMELIERDAFMTAWITRRPAERIILDDSLESHFASIIEGFERLGATVEIYRLPTSVCGTTILGLALGDGKRYPGVTLGLGTDLDARSAFGKALLELAQTGPHLRRMMLSGAWPVPKCPSDVQAMLDHAAYYFPAERRSELDWLRRGESSIKLGELRGSNQRTGIEACASALDAASVRVALADVTSPDVALSPFRVVRAVSPDLQPLWYGYGFERLNTRRLDLSPCVAPNCGIHPIW
jgi:thiazole/oxazole-forming peptide maturase SagD family component